jgi:hypothetical protein
VKALIKKYKPTDIMSKAEMRIEINKVSMKANEDPSTLFTQLSSIEVRYKTTIDDDEQMATILSVCPKEYKSVITSEQRYRGTSLTMEHLEEAMGDHFRSLQFGDDAIKVDDDTLINASGKLGELAFIIWKYASAGLSNEEISNKIAKDEYLSTWFPNNTPKSVAAILSQTRLQKNFFAPMGRSGRMPLENLLRILELKTQKFSSSKIAGMLYTEVPTEHAVNRIDVLYSKYKKKAFQAMKENLSDHKIAYKLFLLLVKNNSNNSVIMAISAIIYAGKNK